MDNPIAGSLDDDIYEASAAVAGGYGNNNPKFNDSATDEDLIGTIDTWMTESRPYHDWMLVWQNKAVRYYLGEQTDLVDIAPFSSNTVYNRIFEGTETIVPIVTGSAHQFIAVPGEDSELSIKRAQKVQKVLSKKYEDLEVQRHLENATRDIVLKRFGVLKWFWNVYTDDVDVTVVDPRVILMPKLRCDANSLPYVLELQEYTYEEIKQYFPNIDPDTLVKGRRMDLYTTVQPTYSNLDVYQIVECWTPEYVVWKQNTKVLKRMKNPYFDWDGVEEERMETRENGLVEKVTYKQFYNYLDYPQMPYVFLNPFTTGDAPVSETSLAEVSMPIQDDINTQKRQIINNLIKMGNGQIYVDSEAIDEDRLDEITSEPGLIIQGKNLASENRIRREAGVALPNAHFSNLQESIVAFDNVFGTHGATRGAGGGKTLGGQILDKQQDATRIEAITRSLNRGVARLADGLVQMMKLFYNESHLVKILGRDGTIEFINFTRSDIEQDIVINVKSGVPPILDPIAKFNQAIQLWQLGAISPETLFERLDFADPQSEAKKLYAWKNNQLLFESQIKVQEIQAAAAAKAAVPGGGAPAGAERKVETSNNVIDRAQASLGGGGAAPLSPTPNGGNPLAIA